MKITPLWHLIRVSSTPVLSFSFRLLILNTFRYHQMSFTAAYINFIAILKEKPEILTNERSYKDPRAVFYVNFNKEKFPDTIF